MSDLLGELAGTYGNYKVGNHDVTIAKKGSNLELDMTDFMMLMITELTNQGIDETMDTSDMLNQMVQMQMITSMVNMTDATTMNYTASLVGKEVTVGKYDADGKLQEICGIVEAVGTMDGQPVVFVNGEYYYLTEIMAIGRLPAKEEDDKKPEDGNGEGDAGGDGTIKPAPDLDPEFGVDHDVDVNVDSDLIPDMGVEYNGENGADV